MTTLDLDENRSTYQIRAYKPGSIKINETTYTQSVIIAPHKLIDYWQPQQVDELNTQSLSPIITLKPDILLIGTGEKLIFLSIDLYGDLLNQGIGVEVMDTSAACRTFNALSSEERNVVAALIIR